VEYQFHANARPINLAEIPQGFMPVEYQFRPSRVLGGWTLKEFRWGTKLSGDLKTFGWYPPVDQDAIG
jgi:hypothetical protein